MSLGLLVRGLAIGFAVASALGPVGLLVIRRTIDRGFRHGLASGLGVASADAVYGAIAASGITAVADWWAILTGAVAGLRARLTARVVRGLNIASAVVIAAFGGVAVAVGVIGPGR